MFVLISRQNPLEYLWIVKTSCWFSGKLTNFLKPLDSAFFRFSIVKFNNGKIKLKSKTLDRELKEIYDLVIKATDRGKPISLSSRAKVKIIVDDINDNDPIFSQTEYIRNLPESIAVGTFVLQVRRFLYLKVTEIIFRTVFSQKFY